jgi:hypothetical protein
VSNTPPPNFAEKPMTERDESYCPRCDALLPVDRPFCPSGYQAPRIVDLSPLAALDSLDNDLDGFQEEYEFVLDPLASHLVDPGIADTRVADIAPDGGPNVPTSVAYGGDEQPSNDTAEPGPEIEPPSGTDEQNNLTDYLERSLEARIHEAADSDLDALSDVSEFFADIGVSVAATVVYENAKAFVKRQRDRAKNRNARTYTESELVEHSQRVLALRLSIAFDELRLRSIEMNAQASAIASFIVTNGDLYKVDIEMIENTAVITRLQHELS